MIRYFFRIEDTKNSYSVILRVLVGSVFLWEGIIKFLFANQGVGRFTKLGFPEPSLVSGAIGCLEILGGLSLAMGLFTKEFSLVFILEMIVAMTMTKIPLLFGSSPLALPQNPPVTGIWAFLHEIRSEYSQALGSLFLFFNGPGNYSLDAIRKKIRS
ncbi:DoxX family protein [Leptospira fluminis]|uniref:DoxX family protein n=1 Tax=Leptospira fluminis TaxID=2484979 RepID=A0A4R9GMS0_9LEPT|nr:DoxX family protein [Leptospira fluminis]TGK17532.1 DoxX family protein [Leptospira fluminis]